jgi:flagellar FliL protein
MAEAAVAEQAAEQATGQVAAAPPPAPAKGRGKLLVFGVAVLLVAGGGAAVWKLGLVGGGHEPAVEPKIDLAKPEAPKVGALYPLDPFIANLADEEGRRYLKATVQVEFFGSTVPEEFTARMPQMRDLLLTLFTSKVFAEIRTPDGKALLRDEIINRLNRALGRDLVKAVYLTEFIVQ